MELALADAPVVSSSSGSLRNPDATSVLAALTLCALAAPLGNLWTDFFKEFLGTAEMIALTFPAGKWIGRNIWWHAWLWHGAGVVAADWVAGGPHVNASVSFSFFILGELAYPELVCRVAAQLAAGLVTFPLCRALSEALGLPRISGPVFDPMKTSLTKAAMDEAAATCLLCLGIFLLNRELPVRKSYLVKQSMTAGVVRAMLWAFPSAGPAMNPTLGTAWAVFAASESVRGAYAFPLALEHYAVYWAASLSGALAAATAYLLWVRRPWVIYGRRPRIMKKPVLAK